MKREQKEEFEYLIRITVDEDGYYAEVPDLPGCSTSAETFESLLRNIQEAVASYLGSLRKHGEPIPVPSQRQVRVKDGLIYASVRVAA
jgi:predicted RNase H-like HicB family nuclease